MPVFSQPSVFGYQQTSGFNCGGVDQPSQGASVEKSSVSSVEETATSESQPPNRFFPGGNQPGYGSSVLGNGYFLAAGNLIQQGQELRLCL